MAPCSAAGGLSSPPLRRLPSVGAAPPQKLPDTQCELRSPRLGHAAASSGTGLRKSPAGQLLLTQRAVGRWTSPPAQGEPFLPRAPAAPAASRQRHCDGTARHPHTPLRQLPGRVLRAAPRPARNRTQTHSPGARWLRCRVRTAHPPQLVTRSPPTPWQLPVHSAASTRPSGHVLGDHFLTPGVGFRPRARNAILTDTGTRSRKAHFLRQETLQPGGSTRDRSPE